MLRPPRVGWDGYGGNNDDIASKGGYPSRVIRCQKSAAPCGQGYAAPGEAAGNLLRPLSPLFASRRLKKRPWLAMSLSLSLNYFLMRRLAALSRSAVILNNIAV